MKPAFASILLLIYLFVNTGFVVNLHYCMDKMQTWEIGAQQKKECSKCGMDIGDSDGCCRDEVKVMKLKQDVLPQVAIILHSALPALVFFTSAHLVLPFQNSNNFEKHSSHSPPLSYNEEIFLTNCVFRL